MASHRKYKVNYLNYRLTGFKRGVFVFFALVCLQFTLSPVAYSQPIPSKEDQIKAAYIFNFTKFTTWPESKFSKADSPIIIGILGEDPFGVLIDEIVKGELVQGRPIAIKRFKDIGQISDCHVFYVHRTNSVNVEDIVERLKGRGVLTISDLDKFTASGGIVKFFHADGKIKFEINIGILKDSSLTISSRLLRLADVCCN